MPSDYLLVVKGCEGETADKTDLGHNDTLIWNDGNGLGGPDAIVFDDLRTSEEDAGADTIPVDQISFNFEQIRIDPLETAATDDVILDGNIITAENYDSAY